MNRIPYPEGLIWTTHLELWGGQGESVFFTSWAQLSQAEQHVNKR